MNATASPPTTDAPERIAQLIWVLCQTVSMRCSLRVRTLSGEQVKYIVDRLLASRKRFRDVVERIRAGKAPKLRALKPRVRRIRPKRVTLAELAREFAAVLPRGWRRRAREDRARARAAAKAAREAAAAGKPVPLWRALRQQRFAWLCPLAAAIPEYPQSAPAQAHYLRQILAEPAMQALLLAHPFVGEALRDVCHALGVEKSLLHMRRRAVVDPPQPAATTLAETVAAPPPAAPPVTPPRKTGFSPAAKPPPPTTARDMPAAREAPRRGVVVVDYWDLVRG